MDRASLKNEAKDLISGNLWTIIKPHLIMFLISLATSIITMKIFDISKETPAVGLLNMIINLAFSPMYVGCMLYMLKFIRKEELLIDTIFSTYNNFMTIIIAVVLVGIITTLWSFLLIIPGIIAAISYSQVHYILADGETEALTAISKSKEMMRGHKMEYFILQLSFIGWIILTPFTLGLLYIYVGPYMTTTNTLFYEKLKNEPFINDII